MYLLHAVQKLELFEIKRLNVAKSKRYYIQNVMVLHGSFFSFEHYSLDIIACRRIKLVTRQ